jgi:hypothetical protein
LALEGGKSRKVSLKPLYPTSKGSEAREKVESFSRVIFRELKIIPLACGRELCGANKKDQNSYNPDKLLRVNALCKLFFTFRLLSEHNSTPI